MIIRIEARDGETVTLDTTVRGKTYAERQAAARWIACEWLDILLLHRLYLSQVVTVEMVMRRIARRYGLVREFEENAVF